MGSGTLFVANKKNLTNQHQKIIKVNVNATVAIQMKLQTNLRTEDVGATDILIISQ
jgi:hypothetical protein